ncbi:hypothetical protein [Acidithiobacillus sulfuriphilus]|uniref:hypothetical protein n=1 Tax=Acidithiobacillus sulfuriphilus TaxID=1867749 RepID=UPI003F60A89F
MARYKQISDADENGMALFVCNASNFFESLKLAWQVIRYPEKAGLVVAMPKKWFDSHMTAEKQEPTRPS